MFVKLLEDAGKQDEWIVDSGAIGSWHVGKSPDRRALSVLNKHNISTKHKARQVYFIHFECIARYLILSHWF